MAQYLQVVDEAFEAGMIRVYDEEALGGPLDAHQDHGGEFARIVRTMAQGAESSFQSCSGEWPG
jgi:hypothetical protein